MFHVVVDGAGQLELDGRSAASFRAGDLIVIPHGSRHTMRDAPDSDARHISDWPAETGDDGLPCVLAGGDGARTSLLCGTFRFGAEARDFLLPMLPDVIHLKGGSSASRWLDQTLRMMADELAGSRLGSSVLVARLADLLFVYVLRGWLEQAPDQCTGWLAAAADPQLSRALAGVHGDAAHPWTVADLAREAGMSRSAFFTRFSQAVGEPPAAYLTRWRMTVARARLRRSSDGLAAVAEEVGYSSEAAFSRAFKRHVGHSPSAWRRQVAA